MRTSGKDQLLSEVEWDWKGFHLYPLYGKGQVRADFLHFAICLLSLGHARDSCVKRSPADGKEPRGPKSFCVTG